MNLPGCTQSTTQIANSIQAIRSSQMQTKGVTFASSTMLESHTSLVSNTLSALSTSQSTSASLQERVNSSNSTSSSPNQNRRHAPGFPILPFNGYIITVCLKSLKKELGELRSKRSSEKSDQEKLVQEDGKTDNNIHIVDAELKEVEENIEKVGKEIGTESKKITDRETKNAQLSQDAIKLIGSGDVDAAQEMLVVVKNNKNEIKIINFTVQELTSKLDRLKSRQVELQPKRAELLSQKEEVSKSLKKSKLDIKETDRKTRAAMAAINTFSRNLRKRSTSASTSSLSSSASTADNSSSISSLSSSSSSSTSISSLNPSPFAFINNSQTSGQHSSSSSSSSSELSGTSLSTTSVSAVALRGPSTFPSLSFASIQSYTSTLALSPFKASTTPSISSSSSSSNLSSSLSQSQSSASSSSTSTQTSRKRKITENTTPSTSSSVATIPANSNASTSSSSSSSRTVAKKPLKSILKTINLPSSSSSTTSERRSTEVSSTSSVQPMQKKKIRKKSAQSTKQEALNRHTMDEGIEKPTSENIPGEFVKLYEKAKDSSISLQDIEALFSPNINEHTYFAKWTVLHYLVEFKNDVILEAFLKKYSPSIKTEDGWSALQIVCMDFAPTEASRDIIKLLIKKYGPGIVTEKNQKGFNAFNAAIYYENEIAVQELIPYVKDLKVLDDTGFSPIHYACMHRYDNANILKLLMSEPTFDVELQAFNSKTPIIIAAESLLEEIVTEIVEYNRTHRWGGDYNKDKDGFTVIAYVRAVIDKLSELDKNYQKGMNIIEMLEDQGI